MEHERKIALLSHDLKNILGNIKLSTQLIQKLLRESQGVDRDEKVLNYALRIEHSINQMEKAIFLHLDEDTQPVAGPALAERTIDDFGGRIGDKTTLRGESTNSYPGNQPIGSGLLIVEDDEDLLDLYQSLLLGEGYKPSLAKTAEEGLELLHQSDPLPSVLIIDGKLPKMSGRELVRAIRAESGPASQIPIVFASAEQDLGTDLQEQISCFLPKPLDFERLLDTVRSLISRKIPTTSTISITEKGPTDAPL